MWMQAIVNVERARPVVSPWYSAGFLSKLEDRLCELADLDFRYETERESLLAVAAPGMER